MRPKIKENAIEHVWSVCPLHRDPENATRSYYVACFDCVEIFRHTVNLPHMARKEVSIGPGGLDRLIFLIRGLKVMLSPHLAELYGVEVRALNQAVKRNCERFPPDFMFQLNSREFDNLKSQIVISSWGGARRARPYAFTEEGVAMLSTVLKSERAVRVNIEIMRAFVRLREVLATNRELSQRLTDLERKYGSHDEQIQAIFEAIRQLMTPPDPPESPRKEMGFHIKEDGVPYRIKRRFPSLRRAQPRPTSV
jgi:hypothetical protein